MIPSISVIIPAYNAGNNLEECLKAVSRLAVSPCEVIVVDDGSTDDSIRKAAASGVTTLETPGRRGPAEARNIGARAAKGDVLFFLDADVCVHPDAVNRIAAALADPEVDAVIGSYDDDPSSQDFLSQYKNLMHCFVHQTARSEASTFWSGCGAMRRERFLALSGFDASYGRPAIEDIELGYRLRQANRRIVLDRDLRVKHLKKWTFWGLVKTDVVDRGIPWTELILRDQNMPNDLNLQISQRISVALVYLMLGFAAFCVVRWRGYFLVPLFAIMFILLGRYWADGAEHRSFSVCGVMIGAAAAIALLAWKLHMLILIPLVVTSVPLLFLRHRYAEEGPFRILNPVFHALYILGVALVAFRYLPGHVILLSLLGCSVLVASLNNRFYLFLAEKRGRWFAVAAFPFHLLYHFYNGISFVLGTALWSLRRRTARVEAEVAWRRAGPQS